jgi:phage gpG-like protein
MAVNIVIQMEGMEPLQAAVKGVIDHWSDLTKGTWPAINARFEEIERELFESEGSSGATGWRPLSGAYQRWKEKNYPGQPLMQLTGNLMRSLTGSFNPDAVFEMTTDTYIRGTTVPYAVHHQLRSRPVIDLTDTQLESLTAPAREVFKGRAIELGFEIGL